MIGLRNSLKFLAGRQSDEPLINPSLLFLTKSSVGHMTFTSGLFEGVDEDLTPTGEGEDEEGVFALDLRGALVFFDCGVKREVGMLANTLLQ